MRSFFFAPESPRPLALMRMLLGAVFFVYALDRWPYVIELYSSAGTPLPVFPGTLFHPPAPPPAAAAGLYALLLFALAASAAGWKTRISLWAALLLTAWFALLDFRGTLNKFTVVGLHLMLLLSLSGCGHAWSVDLLLDPRRRERMRLSPAWPRRLMQILVATIYLGAALTKIRIADFPDGTMLKYALLDDQYGGTPLGRRLATHADLLALASAATLIFEFTFPVLVWVRRMRRPMLLCAAGFHVALAATMYLSIFTPVMLAALIAFAQERDLALLRRAGRRIRRLAGSVIRGQQAGDRRQETGGRRQGPEGQGTMVEGGPESPDGETLLTLDSRLSTLDQPTTHHSPLTTHQCNHQSSIPSFPRLRRRGLSVVLYVVLALAAAAAGWVHQRAADWYGVFDGGAPPVWEQIDARTAEDMLAGEKPPLASYFYRFEIGREMTLTPIPQDEWVRGGDDRFERGEVVYAVVRLARPRPSLHVEFLLLAPGEPDPIARRSMIPGAADTGAWAGFELTDELPRGRYAIVLQAGGVELARRHFELVE